MQLIFQTANVVNTVYLLANHLRFVSVSLRDLEKQMYEWMTLTDWDKNISAFV